MRRTAFVMLAVLAVAACAPGRPYGQAVLAERFCYRTLAEVDCHALPLPGEENRRVGFFDAPIAFISDETPYIPIFK